MTEDFTTVDQHRAGYRLEIVIEQLEERGPRQDIGQSGRAAQIRKPDDGVYVLAIAAPNATVQDTLAAYPAEISLQYGLRHAPRSVDLEQARKHQEHVGDELQLRSGEAAAAIAAECEDTASPVGEHNRHSDIIGGPRNAELLEDGIVQLETGDVEASADPPNAFVKDRSKRTRTVAVLIEDGVRGLKFGHLIHATGPSVADSQELRMQGPDMELEPAQRNAKPNNLCAEAAEEIRHRRHLPANREDPVDEWVHCPRGSRCQPFGDRRGGWFADADKRLRLVEL